VKPRLPPATVLITGVPFVALVLLFVVNGIRVLFPLLASLVDAAPKIPLGFLCALLALYGVLGVWFLFISMSVPAYFRGRTWGAYTAAGSFLASAATSVILGVLHPALVVGVVAVSAIDAVCIGLLFSRSSRQFFAIRERPFPVALRTIGSAILIGGSLLMATQGMVRVAERLQVAMAASK
jgi:hypothetical protein